MRYEHVWGKAPERLVDGLEPYPLSAHLLDTLVVAGALWDTWLSPRLRRLLANEICGGDEREARRWVSLAAGLHDVGKATPVFQMQAASTRSSADRWRADMAARLDSLGLAQCTELQVRGLRSSTGRIARRHEFLGMAALCTAGVEEVRDIQLGADWLAAAVGGHHGHWHLPGFDDESPDLAAAMCSGQWSELQGGLAGICAQVACCDLRRVPELDPTRAGAIVILLTGLTILADWVASSDQVVGAGYGLLDRGVTADSARWTDTRSEELHTLVQHTIGAFQAPRDPLTAVLGNDPLRRPRPLQADAAKVGGGAWFVAYPTGEGKTEAALLRHLAGDTEGLIFGMPTRATTEEMQRRLAAIFAGSGNTILLSHQYAAIHKIECASDYGLDWYSSSIRRLVAPAVAATCDQILVGALPQKHAALRLLALANHHVVLDEVHTYDHYQARLLEELLTWWGATDTRVTLLSATMPTWQRREFARAYARGEVEEPRHAPYPAHWLVGESVGTAAQPEISTRQPDLCTVVTRSDDATAEHVAWTVQAHQAHPDCHLAVVRSTVDDAVSTALSLRAALSGVEVTCLHSRMTVAHRAQVEATLAGRLGPDADPGRPVIVVATQVIEAALDYDFDLMSSDLAPASSLIQRAGRLWRFRDAGRRHSRFGHIPADRVMNVVARTRHGEIADRASIPYFDSELARVAEWLCSRPRIRVPDDVQAFVDETTLDLDLAHADATTAEEIAAASRRIAHAMEGASTLRKRVAGAGRKCRYQDLNALTGGREELGGLQDEDRMGTRFVEQTTATYLLVGGASGVPGSAADLQASRVHRDIVKAIGSMVPVTGGRLCEALDAASASTVGGAWEPANRLLAHARPVDVGRLAEHDLIYDEDLGLITAGQRE